MQISRPEPPLADATIRLEPLARAHLDDLEALGHDPEVGRHTYVETPFTAEKAVTWLARYITGWEDSSCAGFAIVRVTDDSFLGFCSLVRINAEGQQAEIGYITAASARGTGIATAALRLITDWALNDLGLQRVEVRIAEENVSSQKVALKIGFEKEGVLRSNYFKQGTRENLGIYSIVR